MDKEAIDSDFGLNRCFGTPPLRRRILPVLAIVARFAALTLPLLLLRAAFWPRRRTVAELSDRQLSDLGLSRWEVGPQRGRAACDEAVRQRVGGRLG